ncbi:MAG: hypothetical protein ACP5KN_05430 [Armatimonadota bacterium]
MTARRLQVTSGDGPTVLSGIAGPLRDVGRAHSLAQVLDIALAEAGLRLGYDAVMGMTGLAFRVPPWPDSAGLSREEIAAAVAGLDAAIAGGVRLHEVESPHHAMRLGQEAVDAGVPCPALGWGSVKESWSIICGYDAASDRLLGHCLLDAPRERYEAWPPTVKLMIALPDSPSARGRAALTAAVQAGHRGWEESGRERYRVWIAAVEGLEAAPGPEHEVAVELLADARAASAGFLESLAELEEPIPGAWLRRAAELHRRVVEGLEARGATHSPEVMAALETAGGREAWVERLRALLRLEERAFEALRLSATADYPPEEADLL